MDPVHDKFFKKWELWSISELMNNKIKRYEIYKKIYGNAGVSCH